MSFEGAKLRSREEGGGSGNFFEKLVRFCAFHGDFLARISSLCCDIFLVFYLLFLLLGHAVPTESIVAANAAPAAPLSTLMEL